jgi:uncharacterized membrane protein YkoI
MRKLFILAVAAALVSGAVAVPAAAQARGDQASAREEMKAGRNLPVREIERRVIPQMRGHDYLSFEYDGGNSAYRLKFMKEGQVVWVDVDARTARILRVSR